MTLRARVTLALGGLVALTALMAWGVYRPTVLQPLEAELLQARVDRAVEAAALVQGGRSLQQVEAEQGLDLRFDGGPADGPPEPPASPPEDDPHPGPPWGGWGATGREEGRQGWVKLEAQDRSVWYRSGPGQEVAARAGDRWVVLHDDAHFRVEGRLLAALALGGLCITVGASWIASFSLGPVEAAERAMLQVAQGELRHRLDETAGPAELRQMATIFNRMADEVQRRMASERQLMAGLSHEIRTPLTRIRLELELARRGGEDEARIARLEAEVSEIDALVTELLDLSRLEVGRVELRREEVDLRGLVEELLADEGVSVEGEAASWVDALLIRRAVHNLVSNSRKHAPGARVRVTVAPDRLVVEDDGPGVSEAERAQMFQPFWRGTGATPSGYGLGLAIVRQIALLHGGDVQVQPTERGLRVVLSLGRAPGA